MDADLSTVPDVLLVGVLERAEWCREVLLPFSWHPEAAQGWLRATALVRALEDELYGRVSAELAEMAGE